MPQQGINVLALLKGGERYVFLYEDGREQDLLRTFGRAESGMQSMKLP